jgi:hypothetical protein
MKIITNFKDYYDHISFIHGGGDPKIVYVRPFHHNVGTPTYNEDQIKKNKSIKRLFDLSERYWSWLNDSETTIKGILVGDKLFTQIKKAKEDKFRLLKESDLLNEYKSGRRYWWTWKPEKLDYNNFINFTDSKLIELCKDVGLPVFSFTVFRYRIDIDPDCPNLGLSGIASYITANDMYQNLSYIIGNKMKDSPDMMPPIKTTDKDKIIGHGFDYKTSFRRM